MKIFEYKTVVRQDVDPSDTLEVSLGKKEKFLNEMGSEGWELVTVYPEYTTRYSCYYFKRELNQPHGKE